MNVTIEQGVGTIVLEQARGAVEGGAAGAVRLPARSRVSTVLGVARYLLQAGRGTIDGGRKRRSNVRRATAIEQEGKGHETAAVCLSRAHEPG